MAFTPIFQLDSLASSSITALREQKKKSQLPLSGFLKSRLSLGKNELAHAYLYE